MEKTFEDYQREADRVGQGPGTEVHLTGDNAMLLNAALGLAGESGEFADAIKKFLFHGHHLDTDHAIKELGDIMWYLSQAARALGVSLSEVAQQNTDKLWARYPNGFSHEASRNRTV